MKLILISLILFMSLTTLEMSRGNPHINNFGIQCSDSNYDNFYGNDSLDISPHMPYQGDKFIRYTYKPDKRPHNKDEWGEKKYFVFEVASDRTDNGEYKAMPFTTIIRDGEEFFVAFEVVTSFDTKEEALKYADENGITDIDLTDYEELTPEDSE